MRLFLIVCAIVMVRCKHQQHGIGRILVLNAPHHGRKVEADIRPIQEKFLTIAAVIGYYRTTAAHTNQELMAFSVRVLAACFHAGHIEYHEVALRGEGNTSFKFTDRQTTPYVCNAGHVVKGNSRDIRAGSAYVSAVGRCAGYMTALGIDITNDSGRNTRDNRIGRTQRISRTREASSETGSGAKTQGRDR